VIGRFPAEIIEKLNAEINAALADPKMKARLGEFGGTALNGSSAEFGKLIVEETGQVGQGREVLRREGR
jgi:tripartite-type tricarboxylate transporter receptor subunit TctC